jgi:hypothetical protein
MKKTCWAGVLALAGMALVGQVHAATMPITFNGGGVSGSLTITFGTATDALFSNAFEITGISGSFSDSNIGVANAAVSSLVPITHSTPGDPENRGVAPNDFSQFAVATGLPPISNGFITYDNLFWPGGASQTAFNYPGAGNFLDIYGLMFSIGGGAVVDLFSNGVGFGNNPGDTNVFGVVVANADTVLDSVPNGVVAGTPEPSTWAMMILGFASLGFAGYRKARKTAAIAA